MHIASLLVTLTFGLFGTGAVHVPATDKLTAHHPIKIKRNAATATPTGYTPAQIRAAYNLPTGGGTGTIAIVDAYDNPTAGADLSSFSNQFGLGDMPACATSTQTKCFEKVKMSSKIRANSGWAMESALDTQWAHAIAPDAHILLVEAKSSSLTDLLKAVDYARNRSDVKAVSMSWGASEFSGQTSYNSYFTSAYGAAFFASTGDGGHAVSWPAVSRNVTAVGGTTLTSGSSWSESAWSGSGGGISLYEPKPAFQTSLPGTKRSVPDVSYNADPATGVPVYMTTPVNGQTGWWQVGGTSAGAPQWAAIHSLGLSASNTQIYSSSTTHFRDVTSGTNGTCGSICSAVSGYDYVTGLGSPLTFSF